MANTFKTITRDVAPASAGTPETIYTTQSSTRAGCLRDLLWLTYTPSQG